MKKYFQYASEQKYRIILKCEVIQRPHTSIYKMVQKMLSDHVFKLKMTVLPVNGYENFVINFIIDG